ncbi:UDP-N-acetylglucosamine 1-carboxyvinyltransferase [Candidatus Kinetoplastidibacterium crithidiae]|uniref:UDP-N-acetylglucosamine 1-carboxyvinyltransferase n=1 Tax=Candidatus Kinetoplastidibacterium crithidiae TCC036E TaxID=1208918 RepID=M1LVQ0_9PROT|nr:UDP-N-acetylglucosamine 1-carboxyvinyltransferase [Candidatus Kinetoplastibacterium crithidii]AFZ83052.1 UDP-N-acetylglucosamine 1-carboxyvinyltransferase [Candidatus Kinetoplastibacterium crithidii (ex Angomonas deanei ATCC 30255)]AGF47329.1 UDP-N-acetylglucosamine 1-carboxyvinyltransferase [Candidatus Kinetoplastibacterium crithidii TCC036E]
MISNEELHIVGESPLKGEVYISGAKNAALPILCAGLLTEEPIILNNVPELDDVKTILKLLEHLGAKTSKKNNQTIIQADTIHNTEAPYDLVKTMRASILVLGPLLARYGEARISLPGGCSIGQRPVDQHIKFLSALGAEIRMEQGFIIAKSKKLQGTVIKPDVVTVTGTENFMMAASLAKGTTIIENAACEPEITDLAHFLIQMGAKITGHGTRRIKIEGVNYLNGAKYVISPDRIEAGTFLCALATIGGCINLINVNPHEMTSTLHKLKEAGLEIEIGQNWLKCKMNKKPNAVNINTSEYPGLATDMQAQFMAMNTVANGTSSITENIFENRYMHVPELRRMGADITIDGNQAIIRGVNKLYGTTVKATDLRASASLVIAALASKGKTIIESIYHLDRGYEKMEEKLRMLGANILRAPRKE